MQTLPNLPMPNGRTESGLMIKKDGALLVLCEDGQMRVVHPAVVEALASGKIAPGVWAVSAQMRTARETGLLLPSGIVSS